jgi:thiol-disulfide isomerase/thioredoxin
MKIKLFLLSFVFALLGTLTTTAQSAAENKTKKAKITIVDLNDEKNASLTLNDVLKKYKGNVIYLDFWASWCGPCKREMPYSSKLKEEFKGKDVVFVYMSTDKNAAQWESMIAQLDITGENYRASDKVKQEIVEQFNLQYIPRYVLINKEGKVADENAKRPSDPMVKSDINKLLL